MLSSGSIEKIKITKQYSWTINIPEYDIRVIFLVQSRLYEILQEETLNRVWQIFDNLEMNLEFHSIRWNHCHVDETKESQPFQQT